MLSGLLHRAQAGVDRAIGQAINRALVAVPFGIAAGFATASGYLRLAEQFGSQDATLYVALGYMVLGLLMWIVLRAPAPSVPEATAEVPPQQQDTASQESVIGDSEKELLLAAFTSSAPIALPTVVRALTRNFALVLAILAAIFVMTRPTEAEANPSVNPG